MRHPFDSLVFSNTLTRRLSTKIAAVVFLKALLEDT